jgi:hypothetical protein
MEMALMKVYLLRNLTEVLPLGSFPSRFAPRSPRLVCPRLSILFAAGYYANIPASSTILDIRGFDLGDDYFQ